MDKNSPINTKGIASHARSCPFMFVLFPSMLVPIMRPLELKSCQSNQGVAAIWDTPPKSISVKRAQITQIFNYQVACRQENRVHNLDCAISLSVYPFLQYHRLIHTIFGMSFERACFSCISHALYIHHLFT